jgi:hypothetical protein
MALTKFALAFTMIGEYLGHPWFKYCLEAFSAQAGGPTSLALKKYDSLCASLGKRLSIHSDHDLPRMKFRKGFSSGANLMGHEITGCLLVKRLH